MIKRIARKDFAELWRDAVSLVSGNCVDASRHGIDDRVAELHFRKGRTGKGSGRVAKKLGESGFTKSALGGSL